MRFRLYIAILIYAGCYAITFYNKSITFRDSQVGILDKHPNVISKNVDHKKYSYSAQLPIEDGLHRPPSPPSLLLSWNNIRIPLLYQQRQGGLPFFMFRILNKIIGPKYSMHVWHLSTSILTIILMFYLLNALFPLSTAYWGVTLLAIDPLEIFSHAFDISEPLIKILFLAIILLLIKRRYFLCGLLTGLAVYIKITAIWLLIPTSIFFSIKKIRRWKPFILGLSIFLIPYLLLLEWNTLFSEVHSNLYAPYNLNLFTKTAAALFNKSLFFSFLFNTYNTNWFDILLIISTIGVYATAFLHIKKFVKLFIWIILFLILISISITKYSYHMYLYPLSLFSCFFMATLIGAFSKSKIKNFILIALVSTQVIQSTYFIFTYRKKELDVVIDQSIFLQVINNLKQDKIYTPYVIGTSDFTKYEFLSNEIITPINLSPLVSFQTKSLSYILVQLKKGTVITPLNDHWSSWHMVWNKKIDPQNVVQECAQLGISIKNQKFYGEKSNAIWQFTFENHGDRFNKHE